MITISPEIIGYVAGTLTTLSFLPQAIMTLKTRDTESLSLSMYSIFTTGVLLWLIYGIYLDDTAIIYANAITLILASSILCMKVYNTLTHKMGHASSKEQ
ncbi:SemiSWEET transporter [Methyloprofundus sp.]|jgi:MtN3 and saliva related transmembrane protein|uniref:SemiSWEET transporter n=1 Tax=Methyloprofundus sp. TaxID=2020875 RepID=UPI00343D5986